MPKTRPIMCLHYQTCKRMAKRRGVCLACYYSARRAVLAKKTTDQKLVRQGWWLPSHRGHRSESGAKLDALLASNS